MDRNLKLIKGLCSITHIPLQILVNIKTIEYLDAGNIDRMRALG